MKVKLGDNTKTKLKKVKIVSRKSVHVFSANSSESFVKAEAEQKIVLHRSGRIKIGRYRNVNGARICISSDEFFIPKPAASRLMNSIFHELCMMNRAWTDSKQGTWSVVYTDRKGKKLRDSGVLGDISDGVHGDLNGDIRNVLGIDGLWLFDGKDDENRIKVCSIQILDSPDHFYLIDQDGEYELGSVIHMSAPTCNEEHCGKVASIRMCITEELPCPLNEMYRNIDEYCLSTMNTINEKEQIS